MSASIVLLLAFLIGVVCGLRSLTAPAVVAWGAHQGCLNLGGTHLSFMASTITLVVFVLAALGELVADKLPSTPSRLEPPGLIARILLGGFCGMAIAMSGMQSAVVGTALGVIGGVVGAFTGNRVRGSIVKSLHMPDFAIALVEDAIAIGGGLFIVSRF